MALTLNLTISAPCSGGNHFTVTADPTPGPARTYDFSRPEALSPITDEQERTFNLVLVKLCVRQLEGQTQAQMRTAINAKTFDLTVS